MDKDHPRVRSGRTADDLFADMREAAQVIPLMLRQDLKVFSMIEVGFQQTLPGEIESPPLKGPGVGMHLSAPRRLVQQRNERTHEGLEVPSAVDVVPVGTLAYYRSDAASEDIGMLLDNSFFRRVAAEAGTDPDRIEIVPSLSVPDQQIERIGLSFLSEIETGGLGGELFTESLANMLALHLLRSHSSLGRRSRRRIGREGDISKRSLSKTTDYINDILPRKLTLAEIAGAARMSPHHFARSFKAETGLSPHQYVIQRRVERARALLADTDLTLAEVQGPLASPTTATSPPTSGACWASPPEPCAGKIHANAL